MDSSLNSMKFFFWSDTLCKEYDLLKNRILSGEPDGVKPDSERISMLIGKYSDDFKIELDKITNFLESMLSGTDIVRKESVEFNVEDYRYTSILQGSGHQFVVKAYAGTSNHAYISVILDNTERKFTDAKSLISALTSICDKITNKYASCKVAANFDGAFREFLDYCNEIREKHYSKVNPNTPGLKWFHKLFVINGSKYVKLVSASDLFEKDKDVKDSDFNSRYAWAFIDKTTGDIFKPASFSAPAKHARGNIFAKDTWKNVSAFGPAYMR